jgi:hypothetical protein
VVTKKTTRKEEKMNEKKWILTWTETRLTNINDLRVPKNPTNEEILKVIELCKNRIKKLSNCYNEFTMYIDSYKQEMEARRHNEEIMESISYLKKKLDQWKNKYNAIHLEILISGFEKYDCDFEISENVYIVHNRNTGVTYNIYSIEELKKIFMLIEEIYFKNLQM